MKKIISMILSIVILATAISSLAFAANVEIEGGAKAIASIKYNSKTWKPDKNFVISVEVAHTVKTITLSDDITVQRLSATDGFIPGGYRFINAKGTEVDRVTIGSNNTGSVILRQTYKKEKGGDIYYTDYTVEFERLPEQAPTFEGSIEITLDVDDGARAFKESEFTKLYKKNDGGDLKYIAIIDETPDVAVLKLGSKTYNTGDKIELSKISTLKLEPKGEGSTFFTVVAYDNTYSSTHNPNPVEGSVVIDVTVKKSSRISKLTGSVSGGGSLNLSSLGIPAAFKKVAKADLDSITFTVLPEYGDIYNGSNTKLTSRKASLTASELAKCKYKADAVSGNKKLTDTIKYLAYDKDDNEYSGTIEITVKNQRMDLDDIEVYLKSNGKLAFSSLNMPTKFKNDTTGILDCVFFTQPAYGELRYNYISSIQKGQLIDENELYYNTTSSNRLRISNITYIPEPDFIGIVCVYYTAYDTDEEEYEGRIVINVGESDMGEVGTYSIDSDEVLFFSEVAEDIDDMFTDVSSEKNFNYVTFVQPAVKQGSIRYGYESSTKQGTKISSSEKFYYSGSGKLVSDLVFVPDEDYEGEVELEFTVYGKGKDEEYDGTLTVKVSESDYELGAITFNVESGKYFNFDDVAYNINTKFKKIADGNFKYITFEDLPPKSKGILYYDYNVNNGIGIKVEEDDDEFYRNDRTELQIKDLTFVPAKSFTGQITLKYWAYGNGYSLGGKIMILVTQGSAQRDLGDVNLDGEIGAKDLTALARHVAKIEVLTKLKAFVNADVNEDEEVDSKDLTMLARYVAQIIDHFGEEGDRIPAIETDENEYAVFLKYWLPGNGNAANIVSAGKAGLSVFGMEGREELYFAKGLFLEENTLPDGVDPGRLVRLTKNSVGEVTALEPCAISSTQGVTSGGRLKDDLVVLRIDSIVFNYGGDDTLDELEDDGNYNVVSASKFFGMDDVEFMQVAANGRGIVECALTSGATKADDYVVLTAKIYTVKDAYEATVFMNGEKRTITIDDDTIFGRYVKPTDEAKFEGLIYQITRTDADGVVTDALGWADFGDDVKATIALSTAEGLRIANDVLFDANEVPYEIEDGAVFYLFDVSENKWSVVSQSTLKGMKSGEKTNQGICVKAIRTDSKMGGYDIFLILRN